MGKYTARRGKTSLETGSTVSPVAGTTLHLTSTQLQHGVTLFDTPGLLQPPLSPAPTPHTQPVRPVSYKIEKGKSLSIGKCVLATATEAAVTVTCFFAGDTSLALRQPQPDCFKLPSTVPRLVS